MTFHVRLVSMPDRTEELVEALAADAGVSNLLVLPGAAHGPASDAVQFDVRPRSARTACQVQPGSVMGGPGGGGTAAGGHHRH